MRAGGGTQCSAERSPSSRPASAWTQTAIPDALAPICAPAWRHPRSPATALRNVDAHRLAEQNRPRQPQPRRGLARSLGLLCRTCAPHAAATSPSPPRPSLPAVSSSLDTEAPEQFRVDDEQLELGLALSSPWTSLLSQPACRKEPGCRKETQPRGRGHGCDWIKPNCGRG